MLEEDDTAPNRGSVVGRLETDLSSKYLYGNQQSDLAPAAGNRPRKLRKPKLDSALSVGLGKRNFSVQTQSGEDMQVQTQQAQVTIEDQSTKPGTGRSLRAKKGLIARINELMIKRQLEEKSDLRSNQMKDQLSSNSLEQQR